MCNGVILNGKIMLKNVFKIIFRMQMQTESKWLGNIYIYIYIYAVQGKFMGTRY